MNVLTRWLRERTAQVLGLASADQVPLQLSVFELGVDSLMALELRNQLAANLELTLPATILFDYPTVEQLAVWLLSQLDGGAATVEDSEIVDVEQHEQTTPTVEDDVANLTPANLMAWVEQEFMNNQRSGYDRV